MKNYKVRKINSQIEIESCERAEIKEAQWSCKIQPKAWAFMGYLEDKGLYVRLACGETDPQRIHVYHKSPVWKDSALELFLAFPLSEDGAEGKLTNESLYLNFEVNANAAMYAKYGFGKQNRQFIPDRVYQECRCGAVIGRDGWRVDFLIPEWYIGELTGKTLKSWLSADEGSQMYCNFYKISESPEIEHYLSYSRIDSETPNFHRPVYFAKASFD